MKQLNNTDGGKRFPGMNPCSSVTVSPKGLLEVAWDQTRPFFVCDRSMPIHLRYDMASSNKMESLFTWIYRR